MVGSAERQKQMGQLGRVVWLFGLSGAGKTTLAQAAEETAMTLGLKTTCLDGDILRQGLNAGLGFSDEDRTENIRRAAEVARLMADAGLVVFASFITPLVQQRALVKQIVGERLSLVWVHAALETVVARDVKGLYQAAKQDNSIAMTGVKAPFDAGQDADLVIDTDGKSVIGCTSELLGFLDLASLLLP